MKTKGWNARYDEKWKISKVSTSEEMIKRNERTWSFAEKKKLYLRHFWNVENSAARTILLRLWIEKLSIVRLVAHTKSLFLRLNIEPLSMCPSFVFIFNNISPMAIVYVRSMDIPLDPWHLLTKPFRCTNWTL